MGSPPALEPQRLHDRRAAAVSQLPPPRQNSPNELAGGPSEALAGAVAGIVQALIGQRPDAADRLMEAIAFVPPTMTKRVRPSKEALGLVFDRDRYTCRYCGRRTVLPGVLRLLSGRYPAWFPYNRNWKTTDSHPAYAALTITHDHVVPVAKGGHSTEPANIVTACWACNSRKADLAVDEIGFTIRPPAETTWRGLADQFPLLWEACGRPTLTMDDRWWLGWTDRLYGGDEWH